MKTPLPTPWAFLCLLTLLVPSRAADPGNQAHAPAKGSAERKELLDGVRAAYARQDPAKPPVIFVVPYLKVHGDWAWIRVEPQSKDGKERYEPQSGLFRRQDGKWAFITWEPTEEGTDRNAFFKALKAKHAGLPADILPQ